MGFFGCLGQLEAVFAFLGTVILLIFLATTLYYVTKNIYVFYFAEFLGRTVDFKALGEWAGQWNRDAFHGDVTLFHF